MSAAIRNCRWNNRRLMVAGFCVFISLLCLCGQPIGADTVSIEKITYEGWNHCYRLSNGEVELVVVTDIGPRIMKFGFVGKANLMYNVPGTLGRTEREGWQLYGGHRLWVAPELVDMTYYPDNWEQDVKINGNTIALTAPPEVTDEALRKTFKSSQEIEERFSSDASLRKSLAFRKEMIISMDEDGQVTIEHKLTNCGLQTHYIAPWTLTVMNQGGITIVPNVPYAPHGPGHFLPERALILWSYTDLADSRLKFMQKYTTIRQDPGAEKPIKLGLSYTQGWAGYAMGDQLFVKQLDYFPEATYPDMGCSVELFTNETIMEIESLAPMVSLKPGDMSSHRERWKLFAIDPIEQTEADVDRIVLPLGLGEE